MFITLTRGAYSHSEPVGDGALRLIRVGDIESARGESERWYGETAVRHRCTIVTLQSTRDFRGYARPFEARETVDEISALIAAAMPARQVMHDVAVMGHVTHLARHQHAVEVHGQIGVDPLPIEAVPYGQAVGATV